MERKVISEGTTTKFLENINHNFKELYEDSPSILFGVDEPNSTQGKVGDIYIQYENET